MKNIFITTLLLLFIVFTSNAQPIITLGKVTASPVDTLITVPINVTNFTAVGAISLKFKFSDTVLAWRSVSNWNTGSQATNVAFSQNGVASVSIFSITPMNIGTGKLVDFIFRYYKGSTNLQFDIPNCEISDTLGNIVPVTYVSGAVSPAPVAFKLSGIVSYDNTSATILSGVKVFLKNATATIDSTITDSTGSYTFNQVANGNYTLDAACTKEWVGVNATDALNIRKYLVGSYTLEGIRFKSADNNGSDSVNSTDALNIRKRLVSLINSFTIPDWVFETPSVTINGTNAVFNLKGLCTGDVNGSNTPALK